MDNIKVGENRTFQHRGNVAGLRLTAYIEAAATNTAWTTTAKTVDLSKVQINGVANRRNGTRQFLTGDLQGLVMATSYKNRSALHAYGFAPYLDVLTAPAVGVAGVLIATLEIPFPDIFNLYDNEDLSVNISVGQCFSAQVNTSTSQFYVEPITAIGIGTTFPVISSQGVTNQSSNWNTSSSHLTLAALVNIPATYAAVPAALPPSAQIMTGCRLFSKQLQKDINQYSWWSLREEIFQEQAGAAYARNQNHLIHENRHVPLTNVSIDFTFNQSLVVNSENYVVTGRRLPDEIARQKAREIRQMLGV